MLGPPGGQLRRQRARRPGQTVNYRVRARDPNGNALISQVVPVVVASSGAPTRGYANRVLQDGPALYWRLGEARRQPGRLTIPPASRPARSTT